MAATRFYEPPHSKSRKVLYRPGVASDLVAGLDRLLRVTLLVPLVNTGHRCLITYSHIFIPDIYLLAYLIV